MSNADLRGRFIWHDLLTTDAAGAGAFYSRVLGWKSQPSEYGPDYSLWVASRGPVGGMLEQREDSPESRWQTFIGTPDVRATVEAAQRLGARVVKEPTDIPDIGTYAILEDPQGVTFSIYTPESPEAASPSDAPAVGEFSWHDLATTDHEAAFRFYSELFGWEKGEAHDMGERGVYLIFTHGGVEVGGMYNADPSARPGWLPYVRVEDAGRAAAAVKSAGGRIIKGPSEVPGGHRIAKVVDPVGAAFAVHEFPAAATAARTKSAQAASAEAAEPATATRKRAGSRRASSSGRKTPAARRASSAGTRAKTGQGARTAGKTRAARKSQGVSRKAKATAARKSAAGKKKAARKSKAARRGAVAKKSTGARRTAKKAARARPAARKQASGRGKASAKRGRTGRRR